MGRTVLKEKIRESLASVLPVSLIVLLLCFTITPISTGTLAVFAMGTVFLVVGMGLFTLGTDMAMTPMGEHVGGHMTRTRKLWFILLISFVMGVMITASEPDLTVLAGQVEGIDSYLLIFAVAGGVGLFLMVAMLRVLFRIPLRKLLVGCYIVVFLSMFFLPESFHAVAFDSGGVTTGPMTVPFLMALGVGVANIRSDKDAGSDSFGIVALCSVGPIVAVTILGLICEPGAGNATQAPEVTVENTKLLWQLFFAELPHFLFEVFLAIGPLVVFFLLYQMFALRLKRHTLGRILMGIVYTYVGLVLFLTGVNVGFMPVGRAIGEALAGEAVWLLIPVGMIIGYFMVNAEPAVHVLTVQVEEVTGGSVPKSAMSLCLSIGVSVSIGLALMRVVTGISILWLLVPGYAIAILLSFIVPEPFPSIAFDAGGVASGPMAATFLLPLAMGACGALGGDPATDAFGVVAMVAMTPLITVQLMGLLFLVRQRRAKAAQAQPATPIIEEIIDFEEDEEL